MEEIVALVAITGFFLAITTMVQTFLKNRHVERLALIKFGKTAKVFNQNPNGPKSIKWGLTFVSLGLGLLIGYLFESIFRSDSPIFVFGFTFLFGGISMIFYHKSVLPQHTNPTEDFTTSETESKLDEQDDFML